MSSAFAARRPVILIVEDEVLIRLHAAEIVQDAGFDVIEASNADEAIAILEASVTSPFCSQTFRCRAAWMAELAAAVKGRWRPHQDCRDFGPC